MAMVGAGIANDGTVMKPYLVDEIKSPKLDVIEQDRARADARPAGDAAPSAARDLTQMMVAVVDNGTGKTAQIPGVEVAGKTGTAQSAPDRPPYAWFVSFAPADDPGGRGRRARPGRRRRARRRSPAAAWPRRSPRR